MAEASSERTEMPTGRRLAKAREEGNLPQSTELVSAVSMVTLMAAAYFLGPTVTSWTVRGMRQAFSCDPAVVENPQAFLRYFQDKIMEAGMIVAPFLLALAVTGMAATLAIGGWNFSAKPLMPKFNMFNPTAAIGSLFSPQSGVKLLISTVKIAFIAVIVYFYLRNRMDDLVALRWAWSLELVTGITRLIFGVLIRLAVGLLIIGFADLFYQKWKYIDNLKMTKQEVKEEFRSMEGPPEVQRRIRQKQFEIAMRRMLQEVPKANVVVVNPDHVAVALRYDPDSMGSPMVVAKGADRICEKIKEVARAYGVPIIRRPELAREIFATVDLGKAIPEALFVAVAEILALVFRLRRNR